MPFTKKNLDDLPIFFAGKDDVWVTVGPCSVIFFKEFKIPLDGRQYKCGGIITFKNGESYRASFTLNTTTFNFLDLESVYINVGEDWYNVNEEAILSKLNLKIEDIFPYTWNTDRPIENHIKGPYKMKSI